MKQLLFSDGGRPLTNDDLQTLQASALSAAAALFDQSGPFAVSGCQVYAAGAGYTITPGYVHLDNALHYFGGATNLQLPAMLQLSTVLLDERVYETGETKACQLDTLVKVVAYNADLVGNLPVWVAGPTRWYHVQQKQTRTIGDVGWLASFTPAQAAEYDEFGRGRPGTQAWGWALCNGDETTGAARMQGRFPVVYNAVDPEYNAVGKTGGAEAVLLTEAQLPAHRHALSAVALQGAPVTFSGGSSGAQAVQAGSYLTITEAQGGDEAHENRPLFHVLVARQWIGW